MNKALALMPLRTIRITQLMPLRRYRSYYSSYAIPLGDISVLEILNGSYSIGDFTLGFGDVMYDYLHESQQ